MGELLDFIIEPTTLDKLKAIEEQRLFNIVDMWKKDLIKFAKINFKITRHVYIPRSLFFNTIYYILAFRMLNIHVHNHDFILGNTIYFRVVQYCSRYN